MLDHIVMRRMALVAVLTLAAAGCATTPNPITKEMRDGVFIEDATVVWNVQESEARAADPEYLEGKNDMIARLEAAVEEEFRASPSGAEPVAFQIAVDRYTRVGAAMGNIIGGSNTVTADVTVVRKSDGATVGVYENVTGMFASNNGVIGAIAQAATKPDVVGIMANTFADNLRTKFDRK